MKIQMKIVKSLQDTTILFNEFAICYENDILNNVATYDNPLCTHNKCISLIDRLRRANIASSNDYIGIFWSKNIMINALRRFLN